MITHPHIGEMDVKPCYGDKNWLMYHDIFISAVELDIFLEPTT